MEIWSAFPHAAPAKSSLRQAFDKAGDSVDLSKWSKDGIAGGQDKQIKWSRDESDKLHMCWRYGWGAYIRAPTSRDYALNHIKSAFDQDRVPPTECAVTNLDAVDEIESRPSADDGQLVACNVEMTEGTGKTDVVELVCDDGESSGSAVVILDDSPPSSQCRRRLRQKMSDPVSVDESESPKKKIRSGTTPPSAAGRPRLAAAALPPRPQAADPAPPASPPPRSCRSVSWADQISILPPPAHVLMTPPDRLKKRIRTSLATPRSKAQSPELESTKQGNKGDNPRKAKDAPVKAMKAKRANAMKGAKPIQQADVSDIVKVDLGEQEKNDKLKALLRTIKPALRPAMAPCHGECRRIIKVENGKTLVV